jgi:type III secretory pathway component EscV
VGTSVDIATAARDIKAKELCPAIMFHLDSFHCLSLFKELLADLEISQKRKYPNYIKELQDKVMCQRLSPSFQRLLQRLSLYVPTVLNAFSSVFPLYCCSVVGIAHK